MAVLQTSTVSGDPLIYLPYNTATTFQQTAAPTGFTKVTTYNDYTLRVVSGSTSTGGSVAFSTCFASRSISGTVSGSVQAMTLSTSQLPSHTHWYSGSPIDDANFSGTGSNGQMYGLMSDGGAGYNSNDPNYGSGRNLLASGGGGSHDHGAVSGSLSGATVNLAINYVDIILATKSS